MAEKKYYWLKLPRNFFGKHYIKILRAKENGELLVLFYMWMLTEAIDHEGRLRYSEDIPYDEEMLAEASGFANANYFAKVFRRETGMAPSEYLESLPRQERTVPPKRDPFLW